MIMVLVVSPALLVHRSPIRRGNPIVRCCSEPWFGELKAAKRVVLVRHGQSTWNEEGRIQGSSNFSILTQKGEAQAEISGQMLADDSFDVCFASPLTRAKRTAEIIWDTRKEEMIFDPDLREIDLYSFQGLLKHEGKAKFGAAYQKWQVDAPNFSIDDHYPLRELWDRARNCWTRIILHESKSILVVAHNAVNQALLATAIGLGTQYFRTLVQTNCGVSVVDFTPCTEGRSPNVCLNRLNQTPGLPIAAGSSGGRNTSKRIILVCHRSTMTNAEAQKIAQLLIDLRVSSIVTSPQGTCAETAIAISRVQEAANCLGADSIPRCIEMKQMENFDVENIIGKSNKKGIDIPPLHSGWLDEFEDEILKALWDQSEKAWQSLLEEVANEEVAQEKVVVAVGHPALHIALLGHCLNLTKEWLGSFHLDAGSISIIDFPDGPSGKIVIRCINYTSHLDRWSVTMP